MKIIPIKIRLIIYILTFLATATVTYYFFVRDTSRRAIVDTTSNMNYAKLPVVYMTSESGINYNYLHGYTCDVEKAYLHNVVTPLSSERQLPISIIQNGSIVSGIAYEIRSLDGERLIERNEIDEYRSRDGVVNAQLRFRNLLDVGAEYMLRIIVNSESCGETSYYTRIVIMDDANVDRKLSYVQMFSECALGTDSTDKIKAKLETNKTGDNTNLGRVNIHSKLSQVAYAKLKPNRVSDRYITINEINGNTASITMDFVVNNEDETGRFEYYVREFMRINQPDATVTYVYNYDRFMDQKLNTTRVVSTNGDLYLGINSGSDVQMKQSYDKKISAFVYQNELWAYNCDKNQLSKVFTFIGSDNDYFRECNKDHDIKILNVANSGAIDFAVYGYMNRGIHEGSLGISVFSYNPLDGLATEIVFIPRTDTYMSIAKDIDTLIYLNSAKILYLYVNGSIYYIDCTTKECMTVASKVIPQTCMTCESNAMLVYQTGESLNDSNLINILYLSTGDQLSITAPHSNQRLKAIGFIDENLVYGIARAEYLDYSDNISYKYLMDSVHIVDKSLEEIRSVEAENIFIYNTYMNEGKIVLYQVAISEDGQLTKVESTQLLSNIITTGTPIKLTERITDLRQKETCISLPIVPTTKRQSDKSSKYTFDTQSVVNLDVGRRELGSYVYVFSYGVLYGLYDNIADAALTASNTAGVVVNDEGTRIWDRYKSKEHTIKIDASTIELYGSAEDYFVANYEGRTTLNGCDIDLAVYFVDKNCPIVAKTGPELYELVYAYTEKYVYTIDFDRNIKNTYTKSDFNKRIATQGSEMYTCKQ